MMSAKAMLTAQTEMLFGSRDTFGIECEITDTSYPCFWGKVRIWLGGVSFGDFSQEIVSVYVLHFERMLQEAADGPLDYTGLLPYMGDLSWQVAATPDGHVIKFCSGQTGESSVVLVAGEYVTAIEKFTEWVRGHAGFALNDRRPT